MKRKYYFMFKEDSLSDALTSLRRVKKQEVPKENLEELISPKWGKLAVSDIPGGVYFAARGRNIIEDITLIAADVLSLSSAITRIRQRKN